MASLAAIKIDAFEFARDGRVLGGTISLAEFHRLSDVLLEVGGEIQVKVAGHYDDDRKSWLQLECSGSLVLKCQRCLESMRHPVRFNNRLQLKEGDANAVDWSDHDIDEDEFDIIPASQPWLLKDLVEDELILQLPVSPMHGSCALPNADTSNHKLSPFSVLAKLKKH
ncbi:MAG: DUF177 domain-containing protein [Rhodocyclaceae bacterium]|mgnify:CR=1 FL=1|jgi:uncharacterized protein|nr:DUF177 domain-containing protein [Rhodocyclaceae bacterium]